MGAKDLHARCRLRYGELQRSLLQLLRAECALHVAIASLVEGPSCCKGTLTSDTVGKGLLKG